MLSFQVAASAASASGSTQPTGLQLFCLCFRSTINKNSETKSGAQPTLVVHNVSVHLSLLRSLLPQSDFQGHAVHDSVHYHPCPRQGEHRLMAIFGYSVSLMPVWDTSDSASEREGGSKGERDRDTDRQTDSYTAKYNQK